VKKTKITKFPCPICGKYFPPNLVLKNRAIMKCPIHGLYEVNIDRSLHFREFCSKIASHSNKSRDYYTSTERKILKILRELGYKEGFDFIHNVRFKNGKKYYWGDFYFPNKELILEVSPAIWHKMWGRRVSEETKKIFFKKHGITVIEITEPLLNASQKLLKRALKNILDNIHGIQEKTYRYEVV